MQFYGYIQWCSKGVRRVCGPHRTALARGGKLAKIEKKSRANCNSSMFTYNKNKALQRARSYCNNVNIASSAVCYTVFLSFLTKWLDYHCIDYWWSFCICCTCWHSVNKSSQRPRKSAQKNLGALLSKGTSVIKVSWKSAPSVAAEIKAKLGKMPYKCWRIPLKNSQCWRKNPGSGSGSNWSVQYTGEFREGLMKGKR